MRKVRFDLGGILMLGAMLVSDSAAVLLVYTLAAVLHEIGHLLAAKILKIEVKEIAFSFSGVRIMTDERLTSYKNEFLLAFAGPLANLAVFGSICAYFNASGTDAETFFELSERFLKGNLTLCGALAFFAISSLIQALMNLFPVKSFDGGRMIYCAVSAMVSEPLADRVLAIFSAMSACLLWTVALYLMLKIGAGLGIYVFAACIFATCFENE